MSENLSLRLLSLRLLIIDKRLSYAQRVLGAYIALHGTVQATRTELGIELGQGSEVRAGHMVELARRGFIETERVSGRPNIYRWKDTAGKPVGDGSK